MFAISHFDSTFIHDVLRFVVLVSLTAGLRQSAVLLPNLHVFDPDRHLTRADIVFSDDGISFTQKWAKNLPLYNQTKQVVLKSSPNKNLCPVAAYNKILIATPTTNPNLPLLHFPDSGVPISTIYVATVWKKHLLSCGIEPLHCSLHSIRKLCMTLSHQLGFSEIQIKQFGAWSSSSHEKYITTCSATHINNEITNYLSKSANM